MKGGERAGRRGWEFSINIAATCKHFFLKSRSHFGSSVETWLECTPSPKQVCFHNGATCARGVQVDYFLYSRKLMAFNCLRLQVVLREPRESKTGKGVSSRCWQRRAERNQLVHYSFGAICAWASVCFCWWSEISWSWCGQCLLYDLDDELISPSSG